MRSFVTSAVIAMVVQHSVCSPLIPTRVLRQLVRRQDALDPVDQGQPVMDQGQPVTVVPPSASPCPPSDTPTPVDPNPPTDQPTDDGNPLDPAFGAVFGSGGVPSPTADPGPTYEIDMVVSDKGVFVGDLDVQGQATNIQNTCSSNGCDLGSPVTFNALQESGGYWEHLPGSITVAGNAPDDDGLIASLVAAAVQAMVNSKSCQSKTAPDCIIGPQKRALGIQKYPVSANGTSLLDERDTPASEGPCAFVGGNQATHDQCTIASYIQVTAYLVGDNGGKSQAAQITLNTATDPADPLGWLCSAIIAIVSGGLTALDYPKPLRGGITAGGAVCQGIQNL